MRRLILLLVPAIIFASCGGGSNDTAAELAGLKKQRAEIDMKIKALEAGNKDTTGGRQTAVSVMDLQPVHFNSYIEVQSQINGDEVVNATARNQGTIDHVYALVGQHVGQGQVLATLDASVQDQQIKAMEPQIDLAKALYEKQQKLWAQNIGTEVQLMSAKTAYENLLKQKEVALTGRKLNNIIAPISGTVDLVNMKIGDPAPSPMSYIRIVNTNKLKAEASLGENYIGKVKTGDPAILIFPDINDSISTKISFVSNAVDPLSRSFQVQIKLDHNKKLRPNMSCILKIANYDNPGALVVPISVIQKTSEGQMVYVASGDKARLKMITTGRNANGQVEVLSGLEAGDKVIIAGYEDLDEGESISVQ